MCQAADTNEEGEYEQLVFYADAGQISYCGIQGHGRLDRLIDVCMFKSRLHSTRHYQLLQC